MHFTIKCCFSQSIIYNWPIPERQVWKCISVNSWGILIKYISCIPANSPSYPESLQFFHQFSCHPNQSTKSPGKYLPWLSSIFFFINFIIFQISKRKIKQKVDFIWTNQLAKKRQQLAKWSRVLNLKSGGHAYGSNSPPQFYHYLVLYQTAPSPPFSHVCTSLMLINIYKIC